MDYERVIEHMAKERDKPDFADRFPTVTKCKRCFGRGFLGMTGRGLLPCSCIQMDFAKQERDRVA